MTDPFVVEAVKREFFNDPVFGDTWTYDGGWRQEQLSVNPPSRSYMAMVTDTTRNEIVLFGGLAKKRPYPGSTTVTTVNGGVVGMVRTLATELARTHTVVVPDLRGMGLSSHPDGGYDKRTQAGDIRAVLRTGGSAQIPAVIRMLGDKFGHDKLRPLNPFETIVGGLAIISA